MTEFKASELSPPLLHYEMSDAKDVALLDPVNHSVMAPHTVPESLRADPELCEGYTFLQENARRVHLQMLLTAHRSGNDLSSHYDLHHELVSLGLRHGTLLLEGVATSELRSKNDANYNSIAHLDAQTAEKFRTGLTSSERSVFAYERAYQIAGTGVDVVGVDYLKDSDRDADIALTEWWAKLHTLESAAKTTYGIEKFKLLDKWQSSYAGYMVYRNWYIIGKMGIALQPRAASRETVDAALLIGSTHATIGDELSLQGVQVSYKGLEANDNPALQSLVRIVGAAALTSEDRTELLSSHLTFN